MTQQNFEKCSTEFPAEIDYYDPTNSACESAATAYLMWRIDAPSVLWAPEAIDGISGRQPGQATEAYMVYKNLLGLLEQGAELTEVAPFDPSKLLSSGIVYLEEFHKNSWVKEEPEHFYNFWAVELDTFTEAIANFEERVNTEFRHSFHRTIERPEINDLQNMLSDGNAVKVCLASEIDVNVVHMVIVTGTETSPKESYVIQFNPELAHRAEVDGPILSWPLNDFCGKWVHDGGIIGVKRHDA
jgi:hypothetical protein